MRKLKITLEEVNLRELIEILGKYQKQLYISNNCWKQFNFNWENATKEYVEMRPETGWFEWLYPIEFTSTLAFVLEVMQANINYILLNRTQSFHVICSKLQINPEDFSNSIKEIQELLIKYEKVKVCKDGKVIMMNDVW